MDKINYDLNNLKKVTGSQLFDMFDNGEGVFVIKDEYYIYK